MVEDELAIRFATVLKRLQASYSIVTGYVAILFGRSRRSDVIDFIVYGLNEKRFVELCKHLREAGFELMQGDISSENSARAIYEEYL